MKKIIILYLICCFTHQLFAQEAETIKSIARTEKSHAYYVKQAELWWKVLEKDMKNEEAWRNYFKANRYAEFSFKKCTDPKCNEIYKWVEESPFLKEEKEILSLITKNIPNSYLYYTKVLYNFSNSARKDSSLIALQEAEKLQPNNPDLYDLQVTFHEVYLNKEKRKHYNHIWYESHDLSPGLLNYAYNMLASANPNSLILSFSDNNTYPLWMVQDVLNVRTDVHIMNVSLMQIPEYRKAFLQKLNIPDLEVPAGLSTDTYVKLLVIHIYKNKPKDLSLYTSVVEWKKLDFPEKNMYLVGNIFQYSTENIDNIALLKNNFEHKYALDYLTVKFFYDKELNSVNKLNVSYLPGIIQLYNHYKLSGDSMKADFYKKMGLTIAQDGGEEWKTKAEEVFNK